MPDVYLLHLRDEDTGVELVQNFLSRALAQRQASAWFRRNRAKSPRGWYRWSSSGRETWACVCTVVDTPKPCRLEVEITRCPLPL